MTCKLICCNKQTDRAIMVVLVNESKTNSVASHGAADALIITIKSIFINSISTNIHCGEFVLLKNGDIERQLDVDTSWDRHILFQVAVSTHT